MAQFVQLILWWAAVIAAYYVAKAKGRNRFGWTAVTFFVPIVVLVLFVLPSRQTSTA